MKRLSLVILISLQAIFLANAQNVEEIIDRGYEKYLDENYKGAILDFTDALEMDEDNPEIYYLRGVAKSAMGEKRGAMADLDKATELKPAYAEAYYEKGYIYLTDQNAQKAIEEFDKVVKYKPDFPEAYVSRGTAKCMIEDRVGAALDWEKAKELGVSYTEFMVCE